jgi:curved DNA-binding protein CbpA
VPVKALRMSVGDAAAILDVASDASATEIQAAFRRVIAAHHPDLGGDVAAALRVLGARDVLMTARTATNTASHRRRAFVRRRRFGWR